MLKRIHRILGITLVSVVFFFAAFEAHAHRINESYIYFSVTDTTLNGRIEATLDDIDKIIPLDADANGEITREEFELRQQEVYSFFAERLILTDGTARLALQSDGFDFLDAKWGTFARIKFSIPEITKTPEQIGIEYRFSFAEMNPGHLGYALIENNTRTGLEDNESYVALVLRPESTEQTLSLVGIPWQTVASEFVVQGVWHIWLGFDHIAFLIALLLPAVMVARQGAWSPADRLYPSFINVIKIVTTFTVAHSVTLCLASLKIVTMPAVLVEAIIAISIAGAALMNLWPKLHRYWFPVVFIFGLFHGFGFANVLEPLGIDPSRKIVGLAAFNIGVELGQIVIVAFVFPLLFALRHWSLYPMVSLRLGSGALIGLATIWFVERTFDLLGPVKDTLEALVS